ncbi:MAG: hypothetical protein IPO13_03940 [Rhodocyclaceae bacterium]|nr:hypothetical protein [Rhodocyclaceae bacterium]
MKIFSYWLCFALVAIPHAAALLGMLLAKSGVALPWITAWTVLSWFGSLVPPMFVFLIPPLVATVLHYALLALIGRRIWLQIAKREGVPSSYTIPPKVLGYIAAWSFTIGLVVLALSMALNAGSGVPVGMILLPAILCAPWAFFLTELLSFWGTKRGTEQSVASPDTREAAKD